MTRTLSVVLTLLFFCGCGGTDFGPMGKLTGTLTLDGKPLDQGTQVLFMQMDAGYAAFAVTDGEGHYSIQWMRDGKTWDKVPVGTYKILVQPPAVQDVENLDAEAMLDGADNDIDPATAQFPVKYQQHSTSGLEVIVQEGENSHNIELVSK